MNSTELILRILLNTKTERKRQYRTVTYILLGMNVTVSKNMSIKIVPMNEVIMADFFSLGVEKNFIYIICL